MVHGKRNRLREMPEQLIGDYHEQLIGGAIGDYHEQLIGGAISDYHANP